MLLLRIYTVCMYVCMYVCIFSCFILYCLYMGRSLYPRRVNMWYEDFQGGVEQGHLNLGQVNTSSIH